MWRTLKTVDPGLIKKTKGKKKNDIISLVLNDIVLILGKIRVSYLIKKNDVVFQGWGALWS
jgi:hypothetical protein